MSKSQLGLVVDRAESRTESGRRVMSAGALILLGAIALPTIVFGALFLEYSVAKSVLLGLTLSSPLTIVIAALVWALDATFQST